MRLAVFALLGCVFAVTGCYSPKVQSGGFACSATDDPPCPNGFFCVSGLCIDHAGGGGGGGGVGGGGGASVDDLATPAPADLSMTASADMSTAPADMTQPPSDMACFGFGHGCNFKPACCAECCAGGCTAFGYCALP